MDEERELLLDGLDAGAEVPLRVAKSGAVVVTGLPSEKWKPNLTPAARDRAVTGTGSSEARDPSRRRLSIYWMSAHSVKHWMWAAGWSVALGFQPSAFSLACQAVCSSWETTA